MSIAEVIRRIADVGILPVIRAANIEEAQQAVAAIDSGGIPVVEITMTIPDAPAVIRQVAARYGDRVLIGAGTVLTRQQAELCLDAGAQFLVSPGLVPSVVDAAGARGVLAIPGALTPTELAAALGGGATLVKIFPCSNLGGPQYLKALRGPFPNTCLIPTGGVSLVNAGDYIAAGAFALGIGSELVDVSALRAGNPQKITTAAKALVDAVRRAREAQAKTASSRPEAARALPGKSRKATKAAK
jgi:2-dehydro-3-deoxyphosphogluconate aldolase/(4S)-4-hydroxy-2-oxoglutarate aldolase